MDPQTTTKTSLLAAQSTQNPPFLLQSAHKAAQILGPLSQQQQQHQHASSSTTTTTPGQVPSLMVPKSTSTPLPPSISGPAPSLMGSIVTTNPPSAPVSAAEAASRMAKKRKADKALAGLSKKEVLIRVQALRNGEAKRVEKEKADAVMGGLEAAVVLEGLAAATTTREEQGRVRRVMGIANLLNDE